MTLPAQLKIDALGKDDPQYREKLAALLLERQAEREARAARIHAAWLPLERDLREAGNNLPDGLTGAIARCTPINEAGVRAILNYIRTDADLEARENAVLALNDAPSDAEVDQAIRVMSDPTLDIRVREMLAGFYSLRVRKKHSKVVLHAFDGWDNHVMKAYFIPKVRRFLGPEAFERYLAERASDTVLAQALAMDKKGRR